MDIDQNESIETPKHVDVKLIILIGGFVVMVLFLISFQIISSKLTPAIEFDEESTPAAYLVSPTIKIDIAGGVERPGVYTLEQESRIQDALVAAGGLSLDADRIWVAKYLNLAQKAIDGTKIYIPLKNEQVGQNETVNVLGTSSNNTQGPININTASKFELDTLSGIGEVTAQKIIEGRPYQKIDELLSKKIVNKTTFEKIKDKISLY